MNIEEFVEQSLIQIINGVKKAQEKAPRYQYAGRDGDTVNPKVLGGADHAPKGKYFSTHSGDIVQFVSFDIAVTAESGSEAKGGGGLKVLGFGGVHAAGNISENTSSVSRLRFDIPMVLPSSGVS